MQSTSRAIRRVLLSGVGAAAAAAAFGIGATDAHAAFSLGDCGATNPTTFKAQGSSFQGAAQSYWSSLFGTSAGCNGATPSPTYNGNGSGNGNASMGTGGGNDTLNCGSSCTNNPAPAGQRDPTTRFAGSDEAPSATQIASADAGQTGTADDGRLHVIPAALGAATVIVHTPDGCDTSGVTNQTGNSDGTGDTTTDLTTRVRISNTLIEQAFAGDNTAATWGQLTPGITGTVGSTNCTDLPVIRIVRQDSSGTTLSFKTFMDKINTGRGWLTTYGAGAKSWPTGRGDAASIAPAAVTGSAPYTVGSPYIATAVKSGGGELAKVVAGTSGSIGYVALSDARAQGFEITPSSTTKDRNYWIPLQDLTSTATYREPTNDPLAHKPGVGTKGSACATAPIAGTPGGTDPTLDGDWSKTTAVGNSSFAGYPDCLLTYELAWDDNAPVYGNSGAEEQNARAIKDYLSKVVVSSAGQLFTGTDYSPLPAGLRTIAQNGVAAIGWNKSAASGGTTTTTTTTPAATTPVVTTPAVIPPVVTKPSNAFSLTSSKASSTSLTFKVQLPGKGKLTAVATAKSGKKTIKVGTVTATANNAGTVTLTIKLSSAAKSAIKKAKGKKLSVKTVVTFTPSGGTAAAKSKSLTVKAKKAAKKKKK